ncbi:MAG: hypothetical protein GXO87_09270 [Chlorobi bacterium]|nr:hypothetical protein [Chlorobiota bacterium]
MKKLFILMFALVLLAGTTQAQKGAMAVGVQAGLSLPMGSFSDAASLGFGGMGSFIYGINKSIDLVGSIGYITYTTDVDGWSWSTIPILAGARYYFGNGATRFYGLANIGIYASSSTVTVDLGPYFGGSQSYSASSSDFGFSFGGGVKLPIGKTMFFDANAKYNTAGGSGWVDIFAGVDFAL